MFPEVQNLTRYRGIQINSHIFNQGHFSSGMTTHSSQEVDGSSPQLPDVLPVNLEPLTRLSWELGTRTITGDTSSILCKWRNTTTSWRLSVYSATSNTVILCMKTPVGREHFYGTTQSNLHSALPHLESAAVWEEC